VYQFIGIQRTSGRREAGVEPTEGDNPMRSATPGHATQQDQMTIRGRGTVALPVNRR
jgi:hypothetical protein